MVVGVVVIPEAAAANQLARIAWRTRIPSIPTTRKPITVRATVPEASYVSATWKSAGTFPKPLIEAARATLAASVPRASVPVRLWLEKDVPLTVCGRSASRSGTTCEGELAGLAIGPGLVTVPGEMAAAPPLGTGGGVPLIPEPPDAVAAAIARSTAVAACWSSPGVTEAAATR